MDVQRPDLANARRRKRLIIAGLHTEICLTFATVEALKAATT